MTEVTTYDVLSDLPPAAADAVRRNITSLRAACAYPNLNYVLDGPPAPIPVTDVEVLAAAGLLRLVRSEVNIPLFYRITADGYARITLYGATA